MHDVELSSSLTPVVRHSKARGNVYALIAVKL